MTTPAASSSVIRIIVADDHQVVRTGFAALLDTQPDFAVAGTACDGAEAVRICRDLHPDVVLMDVRMPGMDGIEATTQLAGSGTGGPRILILTTFDLDEYVYDAPSARSDAKPSIAPLTARKIRVRPVRDLGSHCISVPVDARLLRDRLGSGRGGRP